MFSVFMCWKERIAVFYQNPMRFYRTTWWRELLCLFFPIFSFIGFYAALPYYGYMYTWTGSLPIGLWHTNTQGVRSHYVNFCLPDNVYSKFYRDNIMLSDDKGPYPCPNNIFSMIKPIMAREGDTVELTMGTVLVNGMPLPLSATRDHSTIHKVFLPRIPRGKYIVKAGTVWVFSSYNILSYDSRYYGGIDIKSIESGVEPVFVYSNNPEYILQTSGVPYCFWRLCWFSYPNK